MQRPGPDDADRLGVCDLGFLARLLSVPEDLFVDESLQMAKCDRLVNVLPPAFLFARVVADEATCGRERIEFTDLLEGLFVSSLADQVHVGPRVGLHGAGDAAGGADFDLYFIRRVRFCFGQLSLPFQSGAATQW